MGGRARPRRGGISVQPAAARAALGRAAIGSRAARRPECARV